MQKTYVGHKLTGTYKPKPTPGRAVQYFTVVYDPSGLFRVGAQFGSYQINDRASGSVHYGCFAQGTQFKGPDGKIYEVRGRTLVELSSAQNLG